MNCPSNCILIQATESQGLPWLFPFSWEQRKLSEVFSSYTDPVDIPHDGYERLGIRSHAKGTFHSYVPAGHELQTAQMHRVAANKFIVNITFGWEHAVAVTDENDAGKLVSHRFPQFSLSDELDPQFLKFIILDERFRHHLWLASPGGAGRNRVLNLNQMLQYEIQIPCVAEQRKIAGALIDIDTLITLHQREQNYKKEALMSYTLTKYEKETVLLYNQSHDPITISTYDPGLRRRLREFAARYPELCRRVDKQKYPDYAEYEIQKERVSIRLLSPMSEEKRRVASEKAKAAGLGTKGNA